MTDGFGRAVVILPTYNEIDNLEQVVTRLRAAVPDVDILIVDDGSPDGTGGLADKLATDDTAVHVMHRIEKGGLGAAYIAGFGWALTEGYGAIIEMDADGSHAPEQLPRLISALGHADLVIGSRYVTGGGVRDWPLHRQVISRGGNLYIRLALRMPVRDATAGFRAYRASVLAELPLDEILSQGYCFQVDLTWRTWRAGHRVVEVPITFTEREHGASKMSGIIFAEAAWRVLGWGLTHNGAGERRRAIAARHRSQDRPQ